MSHYMVGVIHKKGQDIVEMLARYNGNIEVEDYISETKKEIIKRAKEEILYYTELYNNGKHFNPEYYEEITSNYVEAAQNDNEEKLYEYGTLDIAPEDLDEDGNMHSTYNPDSKWDWYAIGGRFNEAIKLKNGEYVSEAMISEIDFSPNEGDYEYAARLWELIVEKAELKKDEEMPFSIYNAEWLKERYGTKECYAEAAASFSTYAIVTPDGEWHEPAPMGWFGVSGATANEEKTWQNNFFDFVMQYKDYYMTIVDCHI